MAVKWSILVGKQKRYVQKPACCWCGMGEFYDVLTAIMSDLLSFAICSSNLYI